MKIVNLKLFRVILFSVSYKTGLILQAMSQKCSEEDLLCKE